MDYAVGKGGVQPEGLEQQGRAAGVALKGHARAQAGQGIGEIADGALVHAFRAVDAEQALTGGQYGREQAAGGG